MNELTNMASPTFSDNLRRLQRTVVRGFSEMSAEEALQAIYFATVYRDNFEAVALSADGFRDNEHDIFDYLAWSEAIETATDGLGASFAAIAVPIYYAEPLIIHNEMPCNNVIVMIGVERLHYRKVGMALYQDGDQFVCTGRWFSAAIESPADSLIVPVRRAVVHCG